MKDSLCSMASIAKKHTKKNKTHVQWFARRKERIHGRNDFLKKSFCIAAFTKNEGGKIWDTR